MAPPMGKRVITLRVSRVEREKRVEKEVQTHAKTGQRILILLVMKIPTSRPKIPIPPVGICMRIAVNWSIHQLDPI